MAKQFSFQFCSLLSNGLSALVYKIPKPDAVLIQAQLEVVCGELIEILIKSLTTVQGRVQVRLHEGLLSKVFDPVKAEKPADEFLNVMKLFIKTEFIALPYLLSQMNDLVTTNEELYAHYNAMY